MGEDAIGELLSGEKGGREWGGEGREREGGGKGEGRGGEGRGGEGTEEREGSGVSKDTDAHSIYQHKCIFSHHTRIHTRPHEFLQNEQTNAHTCTQE